MKRLLPLYFLTISLLTGCVTNSINNNNLPDDTIEDSYVTTSQTLASNHESNIETTLPATTQNPIETTTISIESTKQVPEITPDDGQLVRILDYIPDVVIDLRYATTNNFTGTVIYDDSEAYLCYGTVKKLTQVQNELKEMGYCLLIWDAYRSPEAQWKLWETYPDPTFVANPNNGITSHSRGNTIDISMVYEDGSSVEMPSAFDEFAAIADRDYSDVSESAAANSRLLEEVMYRNGFTGYKGEWWDYSDTNRYDIIPAVQYSSDIGDSFLTEILTRSSHSYTDLSGSSQLIVVESSGYKCNVFFYEKINHLWSQIRYTSGYVGKNGVTKDKVEGDYCTPSGLYTLGFGFGTEHIDTNIEFRLINDNCYWVDDVNSSNYNQWIESENITWKSAEHLIDYSQSYHYGIVINYNMNPVVSSKGSAIFLHCSTENYTAGCVSIPEYEMSNALKWVDANCTPLILIV